MKRLKEIKVAKFSFDYELKVLSKRKNKVIFNWWHFVRSEICCTCCNGCLQTPVKKVKIVITAAW